MVASPSSSPRNSPKRGGSASTDSTRNLPPTANPHPRQEQEIKPGIYFTSGASTSAPSTLPTPPSSISPAVQQGYVDIMTMDLRMLEKEAEEIGKRIKKLKESNVELQEFLEGEGGKDEVVVEAIKENEGVIQRLERRLENVKRRKVVLGGERE